MDATLIFLDEGLFEGGLIRGEGAYKITVDIKKTLIKDRVNFSMNILGLLQRGGGGAY